jgi:hypothetical protein
MSPFMDDLLQVAVWFGIPLLTATISLVSTLWSIKLEIREIKATIGGKHDLVVNRVDRLEKSQHKTNNDILAIQLTLAKDQHG